MAISAFAGQKAPYSLLTNIPKLMSDYYTLKPDVTLPENKPLALGHQDIAVVLVKPPLMSSI